MKEETDTPTPEATPETLPDPAGSRAPSCCAEKGTDFNINHYVYVKLTPRGRECLQQNHKNLAAHFGGELPWEFKLPEEDSEGWSKWQMHALMGDLGKYVSIGTEPPFETTIRIEMPKHNAVGQPAAGSEPTNHTNLNKT